MSKRDGFVLLTILALASVAFAGESPYNPNPSPNRYIFCKLLDIRTHNSYFTSIFFTNQKDIYPVQDAFLHFVAKKYSYEIIPGVDQYHMPVECKAYPTADVLKAQKDTAIQDEQGNAFKIIETEWTFGSAKAVEQKSSASSSSATSTSGAASQQDDKLDSYTMAMLQQDPRGLNLSPLDRQFVMSEAPKAKSYCAKDPNLSQNLDCTCFVRTVFNYRIAHASGPIQQTNFPPLASILTKPDFTCSECVNKTANHGAVACDRANNTH